MQRDTAHVSASLQTPDARLVIFGRRGRAKEPELIRGGMHGQEPLEPTAALLQLLADSARRYGEAGHELITVAWVLDKKGLVVTDHFE